MLAQLRYRPVERFDGAVGAGQHYAALHDDQNIGCKRIKIGARRQGFLHVCQAFTNGFDPSLEVLRDQLVSRGILGIDF